MIETIRKEWQAKIAVIFFALASVWWMSIYPTSGNSSLNNYIFAGIYGLMAFWGGIWGFRIARKWGGFESVIGKAIILLSVGLLFQEFGQIIFSAYYFLLKVEIPYPSLADIGFFGSIPLYIFGIFFLAKAAGSQFTLKRMHGKLQVFLLPSIMLVTSYFAFLQKYEFDWSNPLKLLLDFGYPLGQAIYVAIALLTYTLSKNILGGIMRSKIFFFLIAFLMQYVADYNFLLQSIRGSWANGAYGDYLYLIAYFLMTMGVLQMQTVYKQLRHT